MEQILVVDDDRAILLGLQQLLMQAGYNVTGVETGNKALALLSSPPQLTILDLMLPDMDGFELCRRIRQLPGVYIPIMMLTARDELTDKVLGLEIGADEYVTKPFEPRELLSRVRAMLRFAEQRQLTQIPEITEQSLVFDLLKIWPTQHRVEIANQSIELTATEWSLLELFVQQPGQVFGREMLIDRIWGPDYPGDTRTIDTHVKRLRAKLEAIPNTPQLIQTVRGFGYRFARAK